MSLTTRYRKLLDEEECFRLWTGLGTIDKAAKHLESEGYVHPDTGKRFTDFAIWVAAYRYILDNVEEAWEYFHEDDPTMTREEFEEHLVRKAATVYKSSRTRYVSWLREHGFYEKYRNIVSQYIPLRPIRPREIDLDISP
jgi:hypothetical protein